MPLTLRYGKVEPALPATHCMRPSVKMSTRAVSVFWFTLKMSFLSGRQPEGSVAKSPQLPEIKLRSPLTTTRPSLPHT